MKYPIRNPKSKIKNGFTLMELLLVLVILAVLGAVVLPRFTGGAQKAKISGAKAQIDMFKTALHLFEVNVGRYPTTEEGLDALLHSPANVRGWSGPYLDNTNSVPKDPWGNPYIYQYPGQHGTDYDLYSLGPSGREGGDTINNWTND